MRSALAPEALQYTSEALRSAPLAEDSMSTDVGALVIRIGFWGVPFCSYSIIYPQTLFQLSRPLYYSPRCYGKQTMHKSTLHMAESFFRSLVLSMYLSTYKSIYLPVCVYICIYIHTRPSIYLGTSVYPIPCFSNLFELRLSLSICRAA